MQPGPGRDGPDCGGSGKGDPGKGASGKGASGKGGSGKAGDLKPRIISALILVPLVLALTALGGWPFALLWAAAGMAILYEWAGMARLANRTAFLIAGALALLGGAALLLWSQPAYALGAVALAAALAALVAPRQRGWGLSGVLAACAAALPIVALRGGGGLGLLAVLFIYAVVWSTDIFAYFVGRAVGGPKLWPQVSPNKTWSGAIGGVLAGVMAGLAVAAVGPLPVWWPLAVVAMGLSVASQAGDLAESAAKRHFGVKDASRLIPGHGGILDRLDGFAAAALVALVLAVLRNAADPAAGLLVW